MATLLCTVATPDATGAPRMAASFAAALRQAGHRVIVAQGVLRGERRDDDAVGRAMKAAGVEVRTVAGLERRYHPRAVAALAALAKSEEVACLVGFQFRDQLAAMLAAGRVNRPCVVSAQTRHHFWGPAPLRRFKEMVFARALRRHASLVVCTCEPVLREVIGFGVEERRTALLPNAVRVAAFDEQYPREQIEQVREGLGAGGDRLMLLNVGRLDIQKGQEDLLAAWSQVHAPRARLVMVGGIAPNQRRRMEAYARRLHRFVRDRDMGERVTFAGWRDDVPLVLAASDVYVHAARWEGWPLAVIEAMAAARPVVFTDCAGRPQGFEEGRHGRMVPAGRAEALADAVRDVLALPPAERLRMGREARDLVQRHHDIAAVGRRFVELVEGVL